MPWVWVVFRSFFRLGKSVELKLQPGLGRESELSLNKTPRRVGHMGKKNHGDRVRHVGMRRVML